MTTNNSDKNPQLPPSPDDMPSPDQLNDMLSSLLGGLGGNGDPNDPNSPNNVNPADLLGGLGDENMLNDLMKGGGGMGQLTRMLGGGGLERMMGDMMKQFEGMMPSNPENAGAAGSGDHIDAGHTTKLTAELLTELPDMQLVNQIAQHAHLNMVAAYPDTVDTDDPTESDDVDALLTLPEGQRALLVTTRTMGSIKMEGLEPFVMQALGQDARVLELAISGFKLFGVSELEKVLAEAQEMAIKLIEARATGADYNVTDPLEDGLTDLEDSFTEYDFLELHNLEIAFIRANPDLFIDPQ